MCSGVKIQYFRIKCYFYIKTLVLVENWKSVPFAHFLINTVVSLIFLRWLSLKMLLCTKISIFTPEWYSDPESTFGCKSVIWAESSVFSGFCPPWVSESRSGRGREKCKFHDFRDSRTFTWKSDDFMEKCYFLCFTQNTWFYIKS